MATPSVRFTIKADKQASVFLSAIETNSGKLRLILRSGANNEDETHPGAELVQTKYSIHDSDQSLDYSTLHYTQICKDGRRKDVYYLTEAIKKKRGFAPLFVEATSALSAPRYLLNPQDKAVVVDIGEYDPKQFNFCYGVAIGPLGLNFVANPWDSVNIHQQNFQRFSVVLMWSFATLLSSAFCTRRHVYTLPPEEAASPEEEKFLRSLMTSYTDTQCVSYFCQTRHHLMQRQIQKIATWCNFDKKTQRTMRKMTSHLREAVPLKIG
jgi:hypothetical protein